MKERDSAGVVAVIGLFMVTPVALALMFAISELGAAAIPIWMATGLAAWLISKGPIGEAVAMRLGGRSGGPEASEETLAELDDLRARLAELEERQDFSERLLARKDDPVKLGGGDA